MRLVLLLTLACGLLTRPALADEVLVDGIAAQVGADIVLVSEVLRIVEPGERQMRKQGLPDNQIAKLRAEGLETMIEWRLIEKMVRDADLYASDAEVDGTIEAIANENGLSMDQLRRSVVTQDMSYEDYRQQIKRELERRKVINMMVSSRVTIDESQIEELFEQRYGNQPDGGHQVHLRQILVLATKELNHTLAQSCELVEEIRAKIAKGESFELLAKEHSAAAPQHGGDIGWLHEDSLADWMNGEISKLDDGDVTPVLFLPFGCTVLKLVERQSYEIITLEMAKSALGQEVFEDAMAEEYRVWMEELRDATFIERRGYFADAAQLGDSTFGANRSEGSDLPPGFQDYHFTGRDLAEKSGDGNAAEGEAAQ